MSAAEDETKGTGIGPLYAVAVVEQQVRAAALHSACVFGQGRYTDTDVVRLADKFADFIRTGRVPIERR